MSRKLSKSKKFGQYRACVGKMKRVDGALQSKVFYLGGDEGTAQLRLNAIYTSWNTLKAKGLDHWDEASLSALEQAGVIKQQHAGTVSKKDASKLIGEVLNRDELAPFVGVDNCILPEHAPNALAAGLQKVLARLDVRSKLFEDIHASFMRDSMGTTERVVKLLKDLGPQNAQVAIFNNNGGSPIAFDASEDRAKTTALLADAGIIDVTPIEGSGN